MLSLAAGVLSVLAPLVAVVGALVYVLLLTWYRSFYGALGVEPADAGLTQGSVLTQAGAAALPLLALGFLILGPRLVTGPPASGPPIWNWPVLPAVVLVAVMATLAALVLPDLRGLAVVPVVVGLLWAFFFLIDRIRKRPPRELSTARQRGVVLLFITCMALVLTVFALAADGSRAGRMAGQGRSAGGVAALLRAETPVVEIRQLDGKRPVWLPRTPVRLVGRSGGQLALFDSAGKRALLVPSSNLVVASPAGR